MSRNIALADDLYNKPAELVAKGHVSVEDFVSSLIANLVASGEFIEPRAGLFNRADFDHALNPILDVGPEENDLL